MDRSMDSLCTVDGRSLRRWPRRVTYAVPVCHESDACSPATGELIEQRSRLTQRLTLSQLFSGKITEAATRSTAPTEAIWRWAVTIKNLAQVDLGSSRRSDSRSPGGKYRTGL